MKKIEEMEMLKDNITNWAQKVNELEKFTEYEIEQKYDEYLDEVYGEIEICGFKYAASRALKNVDEIAYRVGFADWESFYYVEIFVGDGKIMYVDREEYEALDVDDEK